MDRLGLTAAELRAYHKALRGDHERKIRVEVQTLGGDTITAIHPRVLDGQVVCQFVEGRNGESETVGRTLTMSFLDPGHRLNFDSESPGDGALYADRMLQVHDSRYVAELGEWVTATVFTGPVWTFQRTGAVVDVVAHSKERLALGELWEPLNIKKGAKKTDAIRTIMERTGETKFAIPDLKARMPKNRSLDRFASPWVHAQNIARSLDRQLFYDGEGRLRLRKLPTTPVFAFNSGRGGEVLGDPVVSTSMDGFKNVVLVVGGKPKGEKKRVRARAIAPRSHPLSPWKLGRNGEPRWLVERVENDNLRSVAECRRRAERILEDRLRQVVHAEYDSLPISHLHEGDLVRLRLEDGGVIPHRLTTFSIPLGTEGQAVMPVGYVKRTKGPNKRGIR